MHFSRFQVDKKSRPSYSESFHRLAEVYQHLKEAGHPDANYYAVILYEVECLSALKHRSEKLKEVLDSILEEENENETN